MINMIWAMDKNNLIGKNNKLPWRHKEDLKFFWETVSNKTVLMGHNTYLSLKAYFPHKQLPFEKIYVASLFKYNYEDATQVWNLIPFIKDYQGELFILGGKSIYEQAFDYADKLYISIIDGIYHGDTYLKAFDYSQFTVEREIFHDGLLIKIMVRK